MSMKARQELLERTRARYQTASRAEKHSILKEFVIGTGYHKKYAITLLRKDQVQVQVRTSKRTVHRKYDGDVQAALTFVWQAANEICAKRLIPFLPVFIERLESSGHLNLPGDTKDLLLSLSPATADRLLAPERRKAQKGLSATKAGNLLKKQVPIRTYADWNDVVPGFMEGDLVAHCGTTTEGTYLNTFTLTDIYSGWTECIALLFKSEAEVRAGLRECRTLIPFPLLGLDTDNGSEFINHGMIGYCNAEKITFTRSRAYKKNDQAHVEEKNGSIVRRFVGYDRYEGMCAWNALTDLYSIMRLYVNFFQPSMKLLSKKRDGAKVHKVYDPAKTPYQRLIGSQISDESKARLKEQFLALDPVNLLAQMRLAQDLFWRLSWNRSSANSNAAEPKLPTPGSQLNVSVEEKQLTQARRYRKTNKPRKPYPKRTHRTRKDPFETTWAEIQVMLEENPARSVQGILLTLKERYPDTITDSQGRTLRSRVREWRQSMNMKSRYKTRTSGNANLPQEIVNVSIYAPSHESNEAIPPFKRLPQK